MSVRLTDDLIRKATRPTAGQRFLWDSLVAGFGVRLTPNKTTFVVQWREAGGRKPRETLHPGTWPQVTVLEARDRARTKLGDVVALDASDGGLPLREAARRWFERSSEDWRPRYRRKVDRLIAVYLEGEETRSKLTPTARAAAAALGAKPLAQVTRSDVLRVADNIKRGAADQLMAILSALYTWAGEREMCEHNPARHRLRALGGRRVRQRTLSDPELLAVWRAFEAEGDPHFGAFQVLTLTGARRREVTGMRWAELDLEAATWTLPPERRKTGKRDPQPFVIDLMPAAVAAIQRQPVLEGSPYVFWGRRDKRPFDFQNALLERVRKAAGVPDWRLHDIRRSVRTGLARLGVSREAGELCLGHRPQGIEAVYNVHRYAAEKREAWKLWAQHVAKLTK